MVLKNITLKTAELGPVKWENVEKLQDSDNGYICFISSKTVTKTNLGPDHKGEEKHLVGDYILTNFTRKPTYKEMINYIIQQEYPNGKENQLLRYGIYDPDDEEYLEYYKHVEDIRTEIKALLA